MECKELSHFNNFELKIYKIIGINQFQKLILFFEKVRHFYSHKKIENYHPSDFDIFSIKKYKSVLLYHVFLHTVSLLLTFICYRVTLIYGETNQFILIFIICLTLLNIYCIVLQRTSYLRIKAYCCKYYKRFFHKANLFNKNVVKNFYEKYIDLLKLDYDLICRIKKAFDSQSECLITPADIDSLNRIYECAEPILPKQIVIQQSNQFSEMNLIGKCKNNSRVYSKLYLRIDRVQKIMCFSKFNKQQDIIVITENADCEAAYRKLIPVDSVYYMGFLCFPIYEVYSKVIDGE